MLPWTRIPLLPRKGIYPGKAFSFLALWISFPGTPLSRSEYAVCPDLSPLLPTPESEMARYWSCSPFKAGVRFRYDPVDSGPTRISEIFCDWGVSGFPEYKSNKSSKFGVIKKFPKGKGGFPGYPPAPFVDLKINSNFGYLSVYLRGYRDTPHALVILQV